MFKPTVKKTVIGYLILVGASQTMMNFAQAAAFYMPKERVGGLRAFLKFFHLGYAVQYGADHDDLDYMENIVELSKFNKK